MKTILQAQKHLNPFQFAELYYAIKYAQQSRENNKHPRYTHEGQTGVFSFRWTDSGELHFDFLEK